MCFGAYRYNLIFLRLIQLNSTINENILSSSDKFAECLINISSGDAISYKSCERI